ncbi:uncharacterized protein DS421_12g373800 [Arachis hypogaea]|nr:uncharacterized protein DS421_12g373800 [Arachis hypogaea]
MERNIHALPLKRLRFASSKPPLNGRLFHFSKQFKENATLPFSSKIRKSRYTTRR